MGSLRSLFSAPIDPEEAKQRDYASALESELRARRECAGAWREYRDAKTSYLEGVEATCGRMDEIEARRRALLAVSVRHLLLHQSSMLANLQFDTQQAAQVAGDAEEAAREELPPLVPRPSPQGDAAARQMRSRSRTGSRSLSIGAGPGAGGGSGDQSNPESESESGSGSGSGGSRPAGASASRGVPPGPVQYMIHLAFAGQACSLGVPAASVLQTPIGRAFHALPESVR